MFVSFCIKTVFSFKFFKPYIRTPPLNEHYLLGILHTANSTAAFLLEISGLPCAHVFCLHSAKTLKLILVINNIILLQNLPYKIVLLFNYLKLLIKYCVTLFYILFLKIFSHTITMGNRMWTFRLTLDNNKKLHNNEFIWLIKLYVFSFPK
jgi:hypothetical protein